MPPSGNFTIVLWRKFAIPGAADGVSIPALIEENAEELRSRYLGWIYKLGGLRIDGRRLIEHLEIRPRFSYWWMTLLAEKCNFAKSPQITDTIRLFAFDDWFKHSTNIKYIELVSANHELRECLKNWCEAKTINFEWRQLPVEAKPVSLLKKTINQLPYTIQAWLWLIKYLLDRWTLRGVGVEEWRKTKSQITFVSYFFNLQSKAAQAGRFESDYWTKLPSILDKKKTLSSWLHLYVRSPIAPTANSAASILRSLNANQDAQQTHVFLDSFLSIKTVRRAIQDYNNIQRISRFNFTTISQCQFKDSELIYSLLWPLFKKDWEQSFFGIEAMRNVLTLNLFEKAFSDLSNQSVGIYLQENQGWEFGMIHAWRSNAHRGLTGFPHSTVRFWDLRYFFDPRSYYKTQASLPMPDSVVTNGNFVKKSYLEGGYPARDLIQVEALRYLYLGEVVQIQTGLRSTSSKQLRILVLGEYLSSNTMFQMRLLREIADELSKFKLTVKAHPFCPIDVADYPELKLELSDQPLSDLIGHFDIAFTGSVTSAAVDVYSAGLKVISALDPESLNLSPLRGVEGVRFVSSSDMLREALRAACLKDEKSPERIQYFNVDPSLPCWRALLSKDHECNKL